MNYYIDFDNTLYSTSALKNKMLEVIAENCCDENANLESVLFEAYLMFRREKIYNIYELCDYFAEKYQKNAEIMKNKIDNVLKNGKEFVYDDVENFLKNIKKSGHKIILLTYSKENDIPYQKNKIDGSGLKKYFDKIIITPILKYNRNDIDYKNGIFIDDNPTDLSGLEKNNPIEIYRIKREDNKYSKIEMEKSRIIEIENFDEIYKLKTQNMEC